MSDTREQNERAIRSEGWLNPPDEDETPIEESIIGRIKNFRRENDTRSAGPVHVNRISSLGHPCARLQVYTRTKPEKRERPNDFLLGVFADGHLHERGFVEDANAAGYDVEERQRSVGDPALAISGHWEGRLIDRNTKESILFEFKSLNSFEWEKLNTIDDMKNSRRAWVQGYPDQFAMYLHYQRKLAEEAVKLDPRFEMTIASGAYDFGIFILKNKQTGELKSIVLEYDPGDAARLEARAKEVNAHVSAGTLPDRIPYDTGAICDRCAFRIECLPDEDFGDGVAVIGDDIELAEMLNEREDLKASKARFDELDKACKKRLKEVSHGVLFVSDDVSFEIKGSSVSRSAYSVEASSYWKTIIKRVAR